MKRFSFNAMLVIGNGTTMESLKIMLDFHVKAQLKAHEPKEIFIQKTFDTFYSYLKYVIDTYFKSREGYMTCSSCPTDLGSEKCIKIYDEYIDDLLNRDTKKFLMEVE